MSQSVPALSGDDMNETTGSGSGRRPLDDPASPLVSIIIPIFNEEELLPVVLRAVRDLPLRMELILVDDHSVDGTGAILKGEEAKSDTRVLYHEKNRGKGAAIVTGLRAATGDIVIVQDADMEYDPQDILKVVRPIVDGETDVCFGSRFRGKVIGMRLPNRVANWILSHLVSLLYGQRITDEATAYKAFRREIIQGLDLKCQRFEFCPEVTAKVLRRGHRVKEVPVIYRARTFEEGKKIGYKDFFIAVATLLKYRFWR